MKERDSGKVKLWEKRRRDRLKDSFHKLAQLLPQYDPAKFIPQNDILDNATQFVKELRLSNSRLLTQQTQSDEKNKIIQELQDEVNKLIMRVKQLTSLLNQASIRIPTGPCIKFLGKRKFKWSDRILLKDAKNKKLRRLATGNTCDAEMTKENEVASSNSRTYNASLNPSLSAPLRETNSGAEDNNEGKKNKISHSAIPTSHHQVTDSNSNTEIVCVPSTPFNQQNVCTPNIPIVKQIPVTLEHPGQNTSSTTTLILTPSSLTPILARVTIPPHQILPKLNSNLSLKLPIVRIKPLVKVVKKTRQRKKIRTNEIAVPKLDSKPAITGNTKLAEKTLSAAESPNNYSKTLVPNSGLPVGGQSSGVQSTVELSLVSANYVSSEDTNEIQEVEDASHAVEISSNIQTVENSQETDTSTNNCLKKFNKFATPVIVDANEISSHANKSKDNCDDLPDSDRTLGQAESSHKKLFTTLIQNDVIPEDSAASEECASTTSNKETTVACLPKSLTENLTEDTTAITNKKPASDLQAVVKSPCFNKKIAVDEEVKSFESNSASTTSTVTLTVNSDSGSNSFEVNKNSKENAILDIEPQVIVNQVAHPVNVMSDSLQDIADLIQPEVTSKPLNTTISDNGASDEIHIPPEENDANDKISECIARSIDLIDQPEAELIELSEDCHWGDGHSPKSPISPTQMFLSMFPLLPRESIISSSETSNHHVAIKSTGHYNTAKSSFYIDSMLPEENSGSSDFSRSINLPGSVSSILNTNNLTSSNPGVNPNAAPLQVHSAEIVCVAAAIPVPINTPSLNQNIVPTSNNTVNSDPFTFNLPATITTTTCSTISPMTINLGIASQQGLSRSYRPSLAATSDTPPETVKTHRAEFWSGRDSSTKHSYDKPTSKPVHAEKLSTVIPYSASNVTPGSAKVFSQMNFSLGRDKTKDMSVGNWTPFYYPENSTTASNKQTLNANQSSSAAPGFHKSHSTTVCNLHSQGNEIDNVWFRSGSDISMSAQVPIPTTFSTIGCVENNKSITQIGKCVRQPSTASVPGCNANITNTYKPYMDSVQSNINQTRLQQLAQTPDQRLLHPTSNAVPQTRSTTISDIGFNAYNKLSHLQPAKLSLPASSSSNNECQQVISNSAKLSQQSFVASLNNTQEHVPVTQPSPVGLTTSHSSTSSRSSKSYPSKGASSKWQSQTTKTVKSHVQESRQNQLTPIPPKHKITDVMPNPLHPGYGTQYEFLAPVPLPNVMPSGPAEQPQSLPFPVAMVPHSQGVQSLVKKHSSVSVRKSNINKTNSTHPSEHNVPNIQNYRQNSTSISHTVGNVRPNSWKNSDGTAPKSAANNSSNASSNANTFSLEFPSPPANFSIANNFYYDSILPSASAHNQYSVGHQNKSRNQPFYLPDLSSVQNYDFMQTQHSAVPGTQGPQQIADQQFKKISSSLATLPRSTESNKIPYNYVSTHADTSASNLKSNSLSNSFTSSNSGGYTAVSGENNLNSPMINLSSNYYQNQHHGVHVQPQTSQPVINTAARPAQALKHNMQNESNQNRPAKKAPNTVQNQNLQGYASVSSSEHRAVSQINHLQHHHSITGSSSNRNPANMTQPLPAQSRPVNWMTDPRPTQQPHLLVCSQKQESSTTSATNPFSVSKLVGDTGNTNNNNSSSGNLHNNYCVEGLIRKQANMNPNTAQFLVGQGQESQVTGSGPAPTFFPFQSQSGTEYGNFSSFTHHSHHPHPAYSVVSNSIHSGAATGHFSNFDQPQTQNPYLQNLSNQSRSSGIGHNNTHYVTPNLITNHSHSGDSSGVDHINRNSSNISQHLPHHTQQPHHGTSVSNFNLSSIFPEMNEKQSCSNSSNSINSNGINNKTSTMSINSSNIYYENNSSSHNPNK